MSRRSTVILAFILLAALAAFVIIQNNGLGDQEIRNKFDCDRGTDDFRKTDIYCDNPDLYRQNLKADKVLVNTQSE